MLVSVTMPGGNIADAGGVDGAPLSPTGSLAPMPFGLSAERGSSNIWYTSRSPPRAKGVSSRRTVMAREVHVRVRRSKKCLTAASGGITVKSGGGRGMTMGEKLRDERRRERIRPLLSLLFLWL